MYQEYLNQLQISLAPLASDELKNLLNNDEKLEEKVDEVLEVLNAQKKSLFEENRIKAERNIESEPKIIDFRSKLTNLSEEGRSLCESVNEKLAQIKEKSGNVSQETTLALLQTAAAESEEGTETLVKQFTDNELGVESFLEEFLKARKTMHLRKFKAEKMQELIRKQQQQNRNINTGRSSGFYPSASHGGAAVPYPMGPMMPMPPPRPY